MLTSASSPLDTMSALENLWSYDQKVGTAALTIDSFIKGTLIMDFGAWGAAMKDVGNGAVHRNTLLGANVSIAAGGLRAPMARVLGLIGCLVELHDKGLTFLPISRVASWAMTSLSE